MKRTLGVRIALPGRTASKKALADALCLAYNTWALEICSSHKDRLIPAAHISLRDPGLAVRELNRVARPGCHAVFVAAAPCDGRSLGDHWRCHDRRNLRVAGRMAWTLRLPLQVHETHFTDEASSERVLRA
jgi:predicted TIM-barrel fold metal-dependent hydrolase